MAKGSCILYSELDVEDNPVNCLYLIKGECRAQPFVNKEEGYYKPDQHDQQVYCKNGRDMQACPRLVAYQTHLKAIGLEKKAT
jgi:hypothetical protein